MQPCIISEPTVSPGWTLEEMIITLSLFTLPMVRERIYLPSNEFPRLYIFILSCFSVKKERRLFKV